MSESLFECTSFKLSWSAHSDGDMSLFLEKGMRGGVSYVCKKYSKASNTYLKSYHPKQESKHIIYLEANNLYGYAMSKYLPRNGFKWIDPNDFDLNKYTSNSSKGCVLEVDLESPKELRELYNDYPLALDKLEIKKEMLCSYQLQIADFYNIPIGKAKKLMPNIFDKQRYVRELATLLEARTETIENTLCIRIRSITMDKTIC